MLPRCVGFLKDPRAIILIGNADNFSVALQGEQTIFAGGNLRDVVEQLVAGRHIAGLYPNSDGAVVAVLGVDEIPSLPIAVRLLFDNIDRVPGIEPCHNGAAHTFPHVCTVGVDVPKAQRRFRPSGA